MELILSIFIQTRITKPTLQGPLFHLAILSCYVLKKHNMKKLYKHLFICYFHIFLLGFILLACNSRTQEGELRSKVVAGKKGQALRGLLAFAGEQSSVPNTYVVVDKHPKIQLQKIQMASSVST